MSKDNLNKGLVIGVDVGGTKILTGLVDEEGRVLCSRKTPMDSSTMETTIASVLNALDDFVEEIKDTYTFGAVGFGLVGRCDPKKRVWVRASNLPISRPVELGKLIEEKYGVPGFVDNDVFCATIAEKQFGAGKTYDDFLVINVGTGLSAGIVTEGRILRGAGNVAGEIGRTSMGLKDWSAGMLEDICSGGGIYKQSQSGRFSSTKEIIEKRETDEEAKALVEHAINALGEAAAALVTIFNPSAIVMAGSVGTNDFVIDTLKESIKERAFSPALVDLKEIYASRLEPGAVGLIGAAQNAREQLEKIKDRK